MKRGKHRLAHSARTGREEERRGGVPGINGAIVKSRIGHLNPPQADKFEIPGPWPAPLTIQRPLPWFEIRDGLLQNRPAVLSSPRKLRRALERRGAGGRTSAKANRGVLRPIRIVHGCDDLRFRPDQFPGSGHRRDSRTQSKPAPEQLRRTRPIAFLCAQVIGLISIRFDHVRDDF